MGIVKDIIMKSLPVSLRLPAWYAVKTVNGTIDDEIGYLRKKIIPNRIMVDVGANIGIYSYAFRNFCREIHAFEPQPACLKVLKAAAVKNVVVHPVALSDAAGTMELHIPRKKGSVLDGLASLRPLSGDVIVEKVEVATLDSFQFTGVAFLKIDVEGHEMNMLKGAVETIRRERPLVLIEIEQRHLATPITGHFAFISALGYRGGFLDGGTFRPLSEFNWELHQKPFEDAIKAEHYRGVRGRYVCNFIFEPDASR
jgi:FkbM family methyltransferase